jgi:hypothetical protein
MSAQNQITPVTRRDIMDMMSVDGVSWAGRLPEPEFLGRIWDLTAMPSTDRRYADAAGDIYQHRVNNYDWDDDWIFSDSRFQLQSCSDERFLEFLAQIVHPVVRPDADEAASLVAKFNDSLKADGFALVAERRISGRIVYTTTHVTARHQPTQVLSLDARDLLGSKATLRDHLDRIDRTIAVDPPAAISAAKELLESTCKVILDATETPFSKGDDLPGLYRKVAEVLRLNAESVSESATGSQAAQKTLRTLTTTVQSLAELRNQLGLGHGRSAPSPALERHARLSFNACVTVVEFLLDTWQVRAETETAQ